MTRVDSNRAALRVGDRVRLDGEGHCVVGLSGNLVRLLGSTGATSLVSMTHLLTVAEFEAPSTGALSSVAKLGLLDGVPAEARDRAR